MDELREKIAKIIVDCFWPIYGKGRPKDWARTVDEISSDKADQILALIKEAGYEKLVENQT